MNLKNKLRVAMIAELIVAIVMIVLFLYETEKLFQFFNLFIAMMSMGFAFEKHSDLVELVMVEKWLEEADELP